VPAALAACALALVGCSAGSASSGASSQSAADAARAPEMASGAAGGSAVAAPAAVPSAAAAKVGSLGGTAAGAGQATVNVRLVRTADVVIEVDQLPTSAARVRAAAEGAGGSVASETTSYSLTALPTAESGSSAASDGGQSPIPADSPARPGESVIVLRVPVATLDAVIAKVVAVGKELGRTSSSVDVTADLADLGSRVKSQQASVDRIRLLMSRATSLQEVVLLESELSRRQADLDALAARQASLADRADLSTLTVTLRTPEAKVATPNENPGFVSGLKDGWRAVVKSTAVVLTVLGALLPLLVVAAIIGGPVWWAVRRRQRRRAAARAAGRPVAGQTSSPGAPLLVGAPADAAPSATQPAPPASGSTPDNHDTSP
jgi:cell division protein FtsB